MKIKITKSDNGIEAKIIDSDGTAKEFSNLEMINAVYRNEEISFEYSNDIDKEEKDKIESLFSEIKKIEHTGQTKQK